MGVSVTQWLHDSPHLTVSGEAILSVENGGRPMDGRGSVPNPAGEAHSALQDPNGCMIVIIIIIIGLLVYGSQRLDYNTCTYVQ